MQEVWIHGIEWDERLAQESLAKVTKCLLNCLHCQVHIRIPRCLQIREEFKSATLQLLMLLRKPFIVAL